MKNAIVIGASGYIGQEICKNLIKKDINVNATYYTNKNPAKHIKASWFHLDISDKEKILQFTEQLNDKPIDAIIFSFAFLEKEILKANENKDFFACLDNEILEKHVQVYSSHILFLLKSILENLKKSSNPNIIFIGSLVGKKALNAPFAYSLSKSCYNGLVESLAKELGKFNIKVNSIDPGMLESGMSQFICEDNRNDYIAHTSLRKFGTASDVSEYSCWMALENTYITGKSIILDGGL